MQAHDKKNFTYALNTLKSGGLVVVTDDESRENEGDLVCIADIVTPEAVNFMALHGRGLICLALDRTIVERLGLPLMTDHMGSGDKYSTAFTLSIEAREGVTTGISAADRAHTIRTAVDPTASRQDITIPGHIFPLRARDGGVLERLGHTEGSVDLSVLAGFSRSAVICEIMNHDGTMARKQDLIAFSNKHNLPLLSISDIVAHRLEHENHMEIQSIGLVTTRHGNFEGKWIRSGINGRVHFALTKGTLDTPGVVDVRIHRGSTIRDIFFSGASLRGQTLIESGLEMLRDSDKGVLIYLTEDEITLPSPQETRSPLDPKAFGIGANILRCLGVKDIVVHTTSEVPLRGLNMFGLNLVDIKRMPRNRTAH